MSVISETEPGGEMVCILGFSARPRDSRNEPVTGEKRAFRVGERVRYLSSFFKNEPEDNPTGHMAVFQPLDPGDQNRYAATQEYFVTLECWEGLKNYFTSRLAVVEWDSISKDLPERFYLLVETKMTQSRVVRRSARSDQRAAKEA